MQEDTYCSYALLTYVRTLRHELLQAKMPDLQRRPVPLPSSCYTLPKRQAQAMLSAAAAAVVAAAALQLRLLVPGRERLALFFFSRE